MYVLNYDDDIIVTIYREVVQTKNILIATGSEPMAFPGLEVTICALTPSPLELISQKYSSLLISIIIKGRLYYLAQISFSV